jgi:mRNA interferase YafQ
MRELILTTRFRRDLRRTARRGKDQAKLREVIEMLADNEPLEPHHRAHQLAGGLVRLWECHIESDWLLVWDEDNTSVTPMRTGTHSGIFS